MAFNFPDAPVVGDSHTEAGVEYVYDGNGVWNLAGGGMLTDKVNKTGDSMSGQLFMTAGSPIRHEGSVYPNPGSRVLSCTNIGYSDMKAFIDFVSPSTSGQLNIGTDDGGVHLQIGPGAITTVYGALSMSNSGIRWGSNSAVTDKFDFSKGICLYGYGGPSQFGFTITSGTLNYIVQSGVNYHDFWCGGTKVMHISASENLITGKMKTATVADGAGGYFIGDNWHGMTFNGSNTLQFIEYHATWQFVERKSGTTGGTIWYTIDKVGAVGNSVSGTSFIDRSLLDDPTLSEFVEGEDGPDLQRRGVNLGRLLQYALTQIVELKAEIKTLKGRR